MEKCSQKCNRHNDKSSASKQAVSFLKFNTNMSIISLTQMLHVLEVCIANAFIFHFFTNPNVNSLMRKCVVQAADLT